jgi:hypothetical protein
MHVQTNHEEKTRFFEDIPHRHKHPLQDLGTNDTQTHVGEELDYKFLYEEVLAYRPLVRLTFYHTCMHVASRYIPMFIHGCVVEKKVRQKYLKRWERILFHDK